eukprot:TRINITY_DN1593_c0_g1_i1.p1 TRINITY_DN1593_c0_g1~~TRINITY_DN1593_c0_g1_i1.p1  ORF type:complete len:358 (+),score=23.35 TRINITY_DN1593_c0_g1_i1:90-1163(+)
MTASQVSKWTVTDVGSWLRKEGIAEYESLFASQGIDGEVLLMLKEEDLRQTPFSIPKVGDIKKIMRRVEALSHRIDYKWEQAVNQRRQLMRLTAAALYCTLAVLATSFCLVTAHERVPSTTNYPPLPDIILDNVPRVAWAFAASEYLILFMFIIFIIIAIVHRARLAMATRFLTISATVFLLRCVTMTATSLSVPGTHLHCPPLQLNSFQEKVDRAVTIAMGLGSTIFGVETCGDYMFSGHCVALTLLGCFICEYTPITWTNFHRLIWGMSMCGIFGVVASHEHYSIDCFVGFYIASRVFGYYHNLASQVSNMNDSQRRKLGIWFPMVAYFERFTPKDGHRNEYDVPSFLKWDHKIE